MYNRNEQPYDATLGAGAAFEDQGNRNMQAVQPAGGRRKVGDLQNDTSETKIEVWASPSEGDGSALELVEYKWGSGIGWYAQKRVTLEAAQVDALRAILEQLAPPAPAPKSRVVPPVLREDNVIQLLFPG